MRKLTVILDSTDKKMLKIRQDEAVFLFHALLWWATNISRTAFILRCMGLTE